jgi:aspartate/methionine/tyrosine aminotransferase
MPIEIESPEQFGYDNIRCNLTESSVADLRMDKFNLDLSSLVLTYTDHVGKLELRERIAAEGPGLTAQDVIITAGAAADLFVIATSLLDPSSHIVVMRPNYATNIETPRAIGCTIDFLNLEFEHRYQFDAEWLVALVRPKTHLISLTTPHNPTGAAVDEVDL